MLAIRFKDKVLSKKYVADFFCYGEIIFELKAMDGLHDDHISQVLNYLKATGKKLGLLVNFEKSRLECRRVIF